ncbi:unnamed protein product [Caenorhabditis angaria]|uniref:Uncharacterized protein n=1 Tax=Caenorhabditis angaria TaxID=860376 RepID=A0A9P1IQP0_9PELO|nr:unnamed protein product [Caenorhabditis angaria]
MLRLLLTFLWLILIAKSKLNDSCQQWLNQLGDLDFFTEAQIRQMCHHQKQWAKDRDEEISKKFMPTTTGRQSIKISENGGEMYEAKLCEGGEKKGMDFRNLVFIIHKC